MNKSKRRLLHFGVTIALVALGVLGWYVLTASKPQLAKRQHPVPVPTVRVIKVKAGNQTMHISGEGTVKSLREIDLVPQVDGKVVYISPVLVNGGEFRRGDILLRIEPEDYRLAVTLDQAKVKDSESKLKLAKEEAAAAREEWHLLHAKDNPGREPPPLVLKEPQLAAAQARLAADRADLQKARLNLQRTELKAPFNGRVGKENVDIGQYVSPGQTLATLYSTEAAEIVLPLEDEDLFWFQVPGFTPGNGPGSLAVVKARIAGRQRSWPGKVVRTEGKLDERTRMINVVVRVKKPYATRPPLAIGLFVTVDIEGHTVSGATVIPRPAMHQDNVVWVVDNNSNLHFRKVEVARLQGNEFIIKSGLQDGERVVISPLKVVTDGMKVRIVSEKEGTRS